MWLDELYALGKICAWCKMGKVTCMIILSKWRSWCSLKSKLNNEWGDKSLYWFDVVKWCTLLMNEYAWCTMMEVWEHDLYWVGDNIHVELVF